MTSSPSPTPRVGRARCRPAVPELSGYCVRHGVIVGESGFKSGQLGAEAQVRRAQDGCNGIDLGLGDVRGGKRNADLLEFRGFPGLKIETWGTLQIGPGFIAHKSSVSWAAAWAAS